MAEQASEGRVTHEAHGHVLKIVIDNVDEAQFVLARDDGATGRRFYAARDHRRISRRRADRRRRSLHCRSRHAKILRTGATPRQRKEGNVDPFGLSKRCTKPIVTAVQGIVFTIGIEMMLAGDIVIAADSSRFCQMEAKRGIAPLAGAHFRFLTRAGWGDAMYHLLLCDEFNAERAYKIGLVQEVMPAGQQVERAMEIGKSIAQNAPLGFRSPRRAR